MYEDSTGDYAGIYNGPSPTPNLSAMAQAVEEQRRRMRGEQQRQLGEQQRASVQNASDTVARMGSYGNVIDKPAEERRLMSEPQEPMPRAWKPPARFVPSKPSSGPSPNLDSMAQRILDEHEASAGRDPEKYERERMAAPPTSGELRYSTNGGPMKSYNVGPNRTDVKGDGDFAQFRQDRVFDHDREAPTSDAGPVQRGAGGVSTPGGTDDAAYQRYRRNLYGDQQVDQEQAQHAMAETLIKDPFARERAAAGIDVGRETAIARGRASVSADADQREIDTQNQMIDIGAKHLMEAARSDPRWASLTPEQRQAADQEIIRRAESAKSQQSLALRLKRYPSAGAGGIGSIG